MCNAYTPSDDVRDVREKNIFLAKVTTTAVLGTSNWFQAKSDIGLLLSTL